MNISLSIQTNTHTYLLLIATSLISMPKKRSTLFECKPPFLSAVLAQLKSQSGIHLSLFWFRFCVSLMCSLGAISTSPLRLACISGDAATEDAMEQPYEWAMMTVAGYLYRSRSSFFTSSTREAVVYDSQLDPSLLFTCAGRFYNSVLTLYSLGSCRNPINQ